MRPRADDLGLPDDALFANAYLGARPIVDALDAGADIVVTGRVADASLFLAPLVHELGWAWDDWDRLAAGVVVGHLLECSGQVTGGNYSGAWWRTPTRCASRSRSASARPTARRSSPSRAAPGGMVTFDTVREQLLYEVHDPARYLNPDVTADFTSLTLDDLGDDRVRVSGTRGAPPPRHLQGSRVHARRLGGRGARSPTRGPTPRPRRAPRSRFVQQRAERRGGAGRGVARGVLRRQRVRRADGRCRSGGRPGWEPPEVIGRLAWRCADEATAARVAQGSGVLGLSGPPTISGFGRARGGKPTQLLAVDAFAVDRDLVDRQVRVDLVEV